MTHLAYTPADPDMGRHLHYHQPVARYTAREDAILKAAEPIIARKWRQEVNGETGKPANEKTTSDAQKAQMEGCIRARHAKVAKRQAKMQKYLEARKTPARVHQIADHMGLSTCCIRKYAHQMAAEGCVVVHTGAPGVPMTVEGVA